MNNVDKVKVCKNINYDIETGVYDLFPKLKSRLLTISQKLFESSYVQNSSKELSEREIKTLEENSYIN